VDLVIEDVDGKVYWNHMVLSTMERRWTRITSVPGTCKSYAVPGDLTGDGLPDLVAVDSSGNAYLYRGKGVPRQAEVRQHGLEEQQAPRPRRLQR
jgi:hypothetical protein